MYDKFLQAEIEPVDISFFVEKIENHRKEGLEVNWFMLLAAATEIYPNDPDKSVAIVERMRCLIALMKDERMRGWTLQGPTKGCGLTNPAVFRATAITPLRIEENRFLFDPEEFFSIALNERPGEASA